VRGWIHKGNQSEQSLGGPTASLQTKHKAEVVCCVSRKKKETACKVKAVVWFSQPGTKAHKVLCSVLPRQSVPGMLMPFKLVVVFPGGRHRL